MKIKCQAVEPDTCDMSVPARQLQSADPQSEGAVGCRYLELWDVDESPLIRTHRIAAFERVCPAHDDQDLPDGLLLWWDGNWKPLADYIAYQRDWFRWQNRLEWSSKRASWSIANTGRNPSHNPYIDMPDTIARFISEPITTGSLTNPGQVKHEALSRVYGWNKNHNAFKNQALSAIALERPGLALEAVSWAFSGHGDARTFTVSHGGQLNQQQRGRVRSLLDIQFGAGKVLVE